jgi:hypothetical protein
MKAEGAHTNSDKSCLLESYPGPLNLPLYIVGFPRQWNISNSIDYKY